MQKRWLAYLGAVGVVCVALVGYGARSASPVVNSTVAIVDPYAPAKQVTVTTGGALLVDGSAAGGGTVTVSNLPATVDTNSGNKSASTPRVVEATDAPANALKGQGATGAAPPSGAVQSGAVGSGATGGLLAGLKTCDLHAKYDGSDNGSITLVTGVASRKIYICGYKFGTGGTATNLKLREGSDANCASNAADLTPAYQLPVNATDGYVAAFWTGLVTSTAAYYVCINASAGNAHQAELFYTIQ